MGGKIDFASRENRSTRFWFTLPLREAQEQDGPAPPVRDRPTLPRDVRRRMRLLVAEDNLVNQKVATKTLQKLGYAADCVATGMEALQALSRKDYDAILMDCHMPELDGLETTRLIRARKVPGKERTVIIALTANAMKGQQEECLEAGMNDYVSKPIDRAALEAVLDRWLTKGTQWATQNKKAA